jgi:transposase-like protein
MKTTCSVNHVTNQLASETQPSLIKKHGSFYRKSDRKKVQRFKCKLCGLCFSTATFSKNYNQKKRHINNLVSRLLVSGVSQREGSKILNINRKTLVRKMIVLGKRAQIKLNKLNKKGLKVANLQFDDLETFEHTKCKPLSVTLAVEEGTRRILGFEVSQMSAKGLLAKIALKKYGYREDRRSIGRDKLFKTIKPLLCLTGVIKSDENPHYTADVKRFFPSFEHKKYKGRQGATTGQGELKKIGFDPLFDLNHTCATLRARANRLFRRTWCTTKKPESLTLHLALVALHHNLQLKNSKLATL